MTRYVFSEHTYPNEPDRWLKPPVGKHLEIMKCALEPHKGVRLIDLCCGLGFGKTLLAYQIAVVKLDTVPGTKILFLEPDWDRITSIFWEIWTEHTPPELYRREIGKDLVTWLPTGGTLQAKPRVITGSKERAQDLRRGPGYTDVIDDETAIGFDLETYQNTLARIRAPSKCLTYITLTTPKVGPYGRFLKRGGNTIFRGRTRDNHYLLERQPDYETNLRASMSTQQARRELDGELVALEGRIWKNVQYDADTKNKDVAWPKGNRHDQWTTFRPKAPWWLAMDIGKATGAYAVIQSAPAEYRGRRLFQGDVWVVVADFCPNDDASAQRAFQLLDKHFGCPVAAVAGQDLDTGASTDGETVAQVIDRVWGPGNVRIFSAREDRAHRGHQFDSLSYLFCSTGDERRLTIARDFRELDDRTHRGIQEMVDVDQYMPIEKVRNDEMLPKNREVEVQHIRDALLNWAGEVGFPPKWRKAAAGHLVR